MQDDDSVCSDDDCPPSVSFSVVNFYVPSLLPRKKAGSTESGLFLNITPNHDHDSMYVTVEDPLSTVQ